MWVLRTEFSSACPLKSSEYSYLLSQMSPAPEIYLFIFFLLVCFSFSRAQLAVQLCFCQGRLSGSEGEANYWVCVTVLNSRLFGF